MSNWEGLDRRKFPRVQYPCLIILRNEGIVEKNVMLTHTQNLGAGGICVIVKSSIKMFSQVEIEIDLLDMGNHIKCAGKVVWNVQRKNDEEKKPLFYDIGIEFQDLNEVDRRRLEEVVKSLVQAGSEIA
jgi:Tfp pilus assembly protein PilZ